jgi:DNA-directed RNA polymerase specialized sigma24 family protein
MDRELRIIAARYRGEPFESEAFHKSIEEVNESVYETGCEFVRPRYGAWAERLAENGRVLWWEFMTKPGGGFDRYDGVRPLAPYACTTLRCICLGRRNLHDVRGHRTTARGPDDGRRNPFRQQLRGGTLDRRQVPLEFDPVDHRSTERAEWLAYLTAKVWAALEKLPCDMREVVILRFWDGANLSAVARERGITPGALHMRLHHALRALYETLGDIKW